MLRLFDAKAVTWSAKYAPDGPLAGRLASLSAAVSRYARAGDRVLDLGCGTGELARTLAAAGLRVTGCDISRQMLLRAARARRRMGRMRRVGAARAGLAEPAVRVRGVRRGGGRERARVRGRARRRAARVRPGAASRRCRAVHGARSAAPGPVGGVVAQRLARVTGAPSGDGPPVAVERVPRLPAGVGAAASRPVVAGGFRAGRPAPGAMPGGRRPLPAPAAGVPLR